VARTSISTLRLLNQYGAPVTIQYRHVASDGTKVLALRLNVLLN